MMKLIKVLALSIGAVSGTNLFSITDQTIEGASMSLISDWGKKSKSIEYNLKKMNSFMSRHSIITTGGIDITIIGEEKKKAGYEWVIDGTDCSNDTVVHFGDINLNSSKK